jgi:hypothetical protein
MRTVVSMSKRWSMGGTKTCTVVSSYTSYLVPLFRRPTYCREVSSISFIILPLPLLHQPVYFLNRLLISMHLSSRIIHDIDHVSYRVTGSAFTGLFAGVSFATLKGLPIPQTSVSMAASFALVSTACYIPERIVYNSSLRIFPRKNDHDATSLSEGEKREDTRIFVSHTLGGVIGGGITGFLFKGKPLQGVLLLSPIMMSVAYGEIRLQTYKRKRIKALSMMNTRNND